MDLSHDSAGASSSASEQYAHIRCAIGVRLSPAQLALLAQAFPDSDLIFVKREFRSGYSGAIVLLVSLGADQAPLVVKLAHPYDLAREHQAYEQFVKQISPQNIAHLQGEPLPSADGQLGLIQYTFAGGESHQAAASLKDYYEASGGSACAAVLNRIFRAYGRYWWANNRPELYTLGEQYDRMLPVHLQVALSSGAETAPHVLEKGKTSLLTIRQLQIGERLRLLGFMVLKVQEHGREVTLVTPPPPNEASAILRIRLELSEEEKALVNVRPGDTVDQIDVEIRQTRHSLLCAAAIEAAPNFEPSQEIFSLAGTEIEGAPTGAVQLNPLYDLHGLLDQVVETKFSTIHGDLNLQNVLVDSATGFAWLVDFSETRRGPTLLDLQRLEVQALTKLLPDAVRAAKVRPSAVASLLYQLHADPLPAEPLHPELLEPFQVLVTIRRLARQYLIDDLDWDEYYRGMIVTLVGALKYKELDALARTLALTAAATLRGLLGHRLETDRQAALPASSKRRFSTKEWAGLGAGLLALLLLALIWRLWSLPAVTPPEPTPTPSTLPTATSASPRARVPEASSALAGVAIFADELAQNWEYWSWDIDTANDSSEVHNGSAALRVAFSQPFGGLSMRSLAPLTGSDYEAVDFWIYRAAGDSLLDFYVMTGDESGVSPLVTFSIPANSWVHKVVPLAELGSPQRIARLVWQEASGNDNAVFYFDDIQLVNSAGGSAATTQLITLVSTPAPTPLPVVAEAGETLLLVAQFTSYASESEFNVAGRIQEAMESQLAAAKLAEVRVAVWPERIAHNRAGESALRDTGAAMLIWGEYDSGRVRVNFTLPEGQANVGWQQLVNSPAELSTTINLDVPREVQALALLTIGRLYRDRGEADKAKAALEQALAQRPSEPDTVATLSFLLGYLYAGYQPPMLDEAITAYSRTIELHPDWLNAHYNRGLAYFDRYWQTGNASDLDAAIEDVNVVLALRPDTVDPLINRGIAYYTRNQPGDLARALADFNRALAVDDHAQGAYFNRGLAYIRAGERSRWEADLARALELRPDYLTATYAFCWGYALDNMPAQALPYCETVAATEASDYSLDARALVYAELERLPEAAADLEIYLSWLRKQPAWQYKHYDGATYAAMVETMRQGENPITPDLLESLR